MEVEFGSFQRYVSERGFGFVNRLLSAPHKRDVFFHIRSIKKSNQNLANKLNNDEDICSQYFWYEIEKTEKGDQVSSIISQKDMKMKLANDLSTFIEKIEQVWMNINATPPEWLELAAKELAGESFVESLKAKRVTLLQEIQRERDLKRKEAERKKKEAEEAQRRLMAEFAKERETEEEEFRLLVEEIRSHRFTHSKQVSSYIMRNRLGDKYRNISGVVKMELEGNTWDFNGRENA